MSKIRAHRWVRSTGPVLTESLSWEVCWGLQWLAWRAISSGSRLAWHRPAVTAAPGLGPLRVGTRWKNTWDGNTRSHRARVNLAINDITHSMLPVKRGQRHFAVTPEECSSRAIKFKEKANKTCMETSGRKSGQQLQAVITDRGNDLLYYLSSLHQSNICRRKMISHWSEPPSRK